MKKGLLGSSQTLSFLSGFEVLEQPKTVGFRWGRTGEGVRPNHS